MLQAHHHYAYPLNLIKYFRPAKAIKPTEYATHAFGIAATDAENKNPTEYSTAQRIQSQSNFAGFSIGFTVILFSPRGLGFELARF